VAEVVDVDRLPRRTHSKFHDNLSMLWVQGIDLISGRLPWVPYELVHLDYRVPGPQGGGCFAATGSGLAAGNHLLEAVSHGITELIERDALTLWRYRDADEQQSRRLRLATVDDPACRSLLGLFEAAGVLVAAWDLTTDIGCPTFRATIVDGDPDGDRRLPGAAGFGCHVDRGVALSRALTEAAQGRLTLIAGSRDDAPPSLYLEHREPRSLDGLLQLVRDQAAHRNWTDVPSVSNAILEDDVAFEVDALRAVGIDQVVMVDLTRPETEIPVVRMVIPGLEGYAEKVVDYSPGRRATALAARRA
jgi:ribosomal protein S12 methylthiotransferase accessory factor